jgi:D-alanyl-D-alanine carboxypeptidase/D-alanyl-D-alanine-endopeptidase (penicillin-binding protein 4)
VVAISISPNGRPARAALASILEKPAPDINRIVMMDTAGSHHGLRLRYPPMTAFRRLLLLLPFLFLVPVAAQSRAAGLPPPVAQALQAAGIPLAAVGVVVQDADASSPRIAVNARQAMNPASTMKLLTTLAALETLGPAYSWKTEVWADAPLTDGVLAGNLYLKGSGDPKLTFEQFWLLLRDLRDRGLREIKGDLVLDRSAFALPAHDAAAFDAKPLRPYNVGPDALLLNYKAIRLTLLPDAAAGKVTVLAEPRPANLDVINLIRLGDGACGDFKEGLRADVAQHDGHFRLMLTGEFPAACGEKQWHLAVQPHPAWVEGVFSELWQELGGRLDGGERDGAVPADARLLSAAESPPLAELVRDINKYSNNVMAQQVYLTLGAATGPATPATAEAAIRAWLATRGLAMPDLVLENGCGLSRQERISAESLARLLALGWKSAVMPDYLASLPQAAVDGTMKKRLKDDGVAGQARIKTGSLEGVKTIAGYVRDRAGHWLIVVFLVNHPNAAAAQAAQDALLEWVYERGD